MHQALCFVQAGWFFEALLRGACFNSGLVAGWFCGGGLRARVSRLVSSLVLVGIRSHYSSAEILSTKDELVRDRTRFLEGFYRRNFLPAQRREWAAFKADLLESCLKEMDTNELIGGLDYLSSARIDEGSLSICRTIIVHGEKDVIAPVEDARQLAQREGVPFHVIQDASHAAFLHAGFPGLLEDWPR